MNLSRAWAITTGHLSQIVQDTPRLTAPFYWALIELVLVGFMASWIESSSGASVVHALVAAAIAWSIMVRVGIEIAWNLLIELWDNNLINLFTSPLSIIEWIVAAALYGIIAAALLFVFLCASAYLMFGYNFFSVGWLLIPLLINYYLSALVIGFLASSLPIYYGVRVTTYVFMLSWLFAPFSGLYYSLSVMPLWAQYIAHALPTYYGVDVLKTFVLTGHIAYWKLGMTFLLNGTYLIMTTVLFKQMFEKSKKQGLSRLAN